MYKSILIPVDLGHEERAEPMMQVARLIGGSDTRFILAHCVEEIPAYVMAQIPAGTVEQSVGAAEETLKAIADRAGFAADVIVQRGHAANAILDIAQEAKADCIVIASHKPGWDDFLIGSTAARVVRHAKCAVHVLR